MSFQTDAISLDFDWLRAPYSTHQFEKLPQQYIFINIFQLNCVPSDQNMVELVLPEMENFPPNVFLILFAVHGEHGGFGMDFNRVNNMRLSGNPCLIEEVIWHKPRIANQKEEFTSLDGLQSVARLGPYEPGKLLEKYKLDTFDINENIYYAYRPKIVFQWE